MKSPVSDLIDGLRIGVARVVTNAEREVPKREAFAVADEAEDHPELAVRGRQVHLETSWELRAVAAFGITAAQSLDLDAVSLELAASLTQRLGSGTAASHRVLGESTLIEEDAGMAPPDWQGLPLAVYRLERPVLGLEGSDLLLAGVTLAFAEHRLPGGIAGDHKLIGAALLGDDELTFQSAADLDVRGLLHIRLEIMAGSAAENGADRLARCIDVG